MLRSFVRSLPVLVLVLAGFSSGGAAVLAAQADTADTRPDTLVLGTDSVTVVAGPEYEAGPLIRTLLGRQYRELWTTPIRVPVLDLETFAGGLEPVSQGGGLQTLALRFEAEDGREYNFRSVNKELSPALPPDARNTIIDWVRQDQTSAQHPVAPLIATPLLEVAGVLNPGPRLVVLPDDPALGEFREVFGGLLGTIEVHANEGGDDEPLFADAPEVDGTEDVLEHVREGPDHRVDSRAFLTARLMSIFLGDWDRHGGQFRWARYDRGDDISWWVPIPEDRDYAFVDYDGFLLDVARLRLPRLIEFEMEYQNLLALMANSTDLNRQLLAPLSRAEWDSVAAFVQARLTDEAIDAALRQAPAPYLERNAPDLVRKLQARRDRLTEVADRYYELMAVNVEVHATDEDDRLEVERMANASLEVRLYAEDSEWGDDPYFRRTFYPAETSEIRIFLYDGDDEAVIRGEGRGEILLRVVGGEGDDELTDRSQGPTVIYDAEGANEIGVGPDTRVDRRPYEVPVYEQGLLPNPPRDWGSSRSPFTPWAEWKSNVGVVIGGGPTWTRYGFRHDPYAWRLGIRGLWAPDHTRFAVEARGDFRPENSDQHLEVLARASNLEVTRFHGYGNQTPSTGDDERYLVWQRQLEVEPTWHLLLSPFAEFAAGPVLKYTDPEVDPLLDPDSPAAELRPFGTEPVGQLGGAASIEVDFRDDPAFPRRGVVLRVGGATYAAEETEATDSDAELFGKAYAEGSAYFTVPALTETTLALRAGGERVWGRFPLHEAAFLGGSRTLRGYAADRFAGDAAVYGGAELRIPLVYMKLITRGDLGVNFWTDAGRVYVDGESTGGWHTAAGGGVWFHTLGTVASINYARGDEDRIYLRLGVPF